MISLEKWKFLKPLLKLPNNVGDLGNLIVAKGFKSCPKSNKLPNLVTLLQAQGVNNGLGLSKLLHKANM